MNGHLSKVKKNINPCCYTCTWGYIFLDTGEVLYGDLALSCVRITLFNFIARGLRVCSSKKMF